jgi:hypothetical protein
VTLSIQECESRSLTLDVMHKVFYLTSYRSQVLPKSSGAQ